MSATLDIQELLCRMPVGQIFTSRDLIGICSRAALDSCLKRLVDSGVIVRVARGVFSNGSQMPQITPMELAQIKARSFHKEVFEHAETTAQRLGFIPKPQQIKTREPLIFATNGTGSSSFQSIFGRIHLKAASARKRNEFQDEVWELVKSLWVLGNGGITDKIRNRINQMWGRKSQASLQRFCASIPQWLMEQFQPDYKSIYATTCSILVPHASDELNARYQQSSECKNLVDNMPSGFSDVGPPDSDFDYLSASISPDTDIPSGDTCWCPDSDECICPVFTCSYCLSQPIRNRFSIALG